MRNVCKVFFTLLVASSAFLIGFYLGQEKVSAKISDFQEEQEESF